MTIPTNAMKKRHSFRIIRRTSRVQPWARSFATSPNIRSRIFTLNPLVEYALPVHCRRLPVGFLVAQFRYTYIGESGKWDWPIDLQWFGVVHEILISCLSVGMPSSTREHPCEIGMFLPPLVGKKGLPIPILSSTPVVHKASSHGMIRRKRSCLPSEEVLVLRTLSSVRKIGNFPDWSGLMFEMQI